MAEPGYLISRSTAEAIKKLIEEPVQPGMVSRAKFIGGRIGVQDIRYNATTHVLQYTKKINPAEEDWVDAVQFDACNTNANVSLETTGESQRSYQLSFNPPTAT